LALNGQGHRRTGYGVGEIDLDTRMEIGTLDRLLGTPRPSAAEQVAEHVPEVTEAATKIAEIDPNTAVLPSGATTTAAEWIPTSPKISVHAAELIELRPSFRIGKNRVCLLDLLETGFRVGISGIDVRMVLARQLPIRLLDLRGVGIP
jgi:hypothetical protein